MARFTTNRHDLQFTLAYSNRFGSFADVNEVSNFSNPQYTPTFKSVRTGVWEWTPENDDYTADGHFLFRDDGSGIFGLSSVFYIGNATSETSPSESSEPSSAETTSLSAAPESSTSGDPPISVVPISTSGPTSQNASGRSTSTVHSFTGAPFPTFVPTASPPSPPRPHSAASVIGGAVGGSLGGILLLLLIGILSRRKQTTQGGLRTEDSPTYNPDKPELGQAPGTPAELDSLGILTELPSPQDTRFSELTSHHPSTFIELGHENIEHTVQAKSSSVDDDPDQGRVEKHVHPAGSVYELPS
ncbi:hypothetical protein DL546_000979 [Coniochaeta pulveracea]|uniref:Mid2 domain-containing protein n=1 Tax=Coniochaeta pulveracea TaxID=177199 RepID=A0A420Y5I3_9PEZI|nr:hypothetical protein DL546_000979 [Coniochaeta pulveracea]